MSDENPNLSQAPQTTSRLNPMALAAALASLDPDKDADWEPDGKPSLAALEVMIGAAVTREDVDLAAPDMRRTTGSQTLVALPSEKGPTEEVAASSSIEARVSALEADVDFLRRLHGWPTKAT